MLIYTCITVSKYNQEISKGIKLTLTYINTTCITVTVISYNSKILKKPGSGSCNLFSKISHW